MTGPPSRYDVHADWYLDYTRDWGSASAQFLPDDLVGERVLDLACGYGQLSRIVAGLGAEVTGIDLSAGLLQRAREIEAVEPHGIRYLQGNAADPGWWDLAPFDGVVCNMALMDIDDLDGAFTSAAAVLKPAGWFLFTLFHPCFPGNSTGTPPSWPPGGYASEGWWTTGSSGVRGHVGAHHRMLSSYLNAVLRAGLQFEEFFEDHSDLPRLLAVRCRRPAGVNRGTGSGLG